MKKPTRPTKVIKEFHIDPRDISLEDILYKIPGGVDLATIYYDELFHTFLVPSRRVSDEEYEIKINEYNEQLIEWSKYRKYILKEELRKLEEVSK